MQKAILDILHDKDTDIDAILQSLTPSDQAHSNAVALITHQLMQCAAKALPQDYGEEYLVQEAGHAALYHDIGLALIPSRILLKEEDLTGAEFRVIQQHAKYGGTLLDNRRKAQADHPERARFWALAAEIASGHHERWDGRGYPFGQMATAIPVSARAVAIADSYDCMVRGSCYRMPLPPDYALLEIKQNSGTQFDPMLSELFCMQYDSILNLSSQGGTFL